MSEFKEIGRQNVEVVIPIQTIFSSQIVLDCESKAKAQLDRVLLLLTQLTCGGGGGELYLTFQIFRNGRFGGRKCNVDPDKSAEVSNLR